MNRKPKILVVDADRILVELLDEWLGAEDFEVMHDAIPAADHDRHYDLAIVDLPFLRLGCTERIGRIANEHPEVPIVVVSATLFQSAACSNALARRLGVASVLPKPLARGTLLDTVRRLLDA